MWNRMNSFKMSLEPKRDVIERKLLSRLLVSGWRQVLPSLKMFFCCLGKCSLWNLQLTTNRSEIFLTATCKVIVTAPCHFLIWLLTQAILIKREILRKKTGREDLTLFTLLFVDAKAALASARLWFQFSFRLLLGNIF